VNDVVIGDFDNNQRNDMLLLHGALRPSQVLSFNGNRIEAQFINQDRGFTFKSSGVLQVQLDWSKTFVTTPMSTSVPAGRTRPRSISRSIRTTPPRTDQAKEPSANNGELHVGYDPATQTWTFMQYWGNKYIYTYIEVQSSPRSQAWCRSASRGPTARSSPYCSRIFHRHDRSDRGERLGAKINCVSGVAADFDNDMDVTCS